MHKFNEKKHIESMIPARDKLVSYLFKKHNITFKPEDELKKNVIFEREGKILKISYQCFYRISGMAMKAIKKSKEDNSNDVSLIPITEEMFLNEIMKSVVEYNLVPRETK